ncbi:Fc.00g027370.m01.CDS01 [Cosmosporella sp. VM-42]
MRILNPDRDRETEHRQTFAMELVRTRKSRENTKRPESPESGNIASGGTSGIVQPPLLHYPEPAQNSQYEYAHDVAPSSTATHVLSNPMGPLFSSNPDPTGQQPPPGMKPQVKTRLWEDEGTLCFEVEARGVIVARREDNYMINGTKLLNVAGMTRGRRDGVLKSEKVRHVVNIGPMDLKGVWIPYDRALDFANKEKITEILYPLFVHNIAPIMAAYERSKQAESQMQILTTPKLESTDQHSPFHVLPAAIAPSLSASNPSLPTPPQDAMHQLAQFLGLSHPIVAPEPQPPGDDDDTVGSCASGLLEDEPFDTESSSASDYSEGVPYLEDGHPFLRVKPFIVRSALRAFVLEVLRYEQHTQSRPRDDPGGPSNTVCGTATNSRGNQRSHKKRPYEENKQHTEREEANDGNGTPRKRTRSTKQSAMHHVFLACPFAKKNPVKYRGCHAHVLKRIKDVKQHIHRWHQLPVYCGRCQEIFDTERERDLHLQAAERCEARDDIQHEGVTLSQQDKLSERVSAKMTLKEQWYTIFDILFPGHLPRPESPYTNKDLSIDLEAFQDMMRSDGPSIIISALRRHGIELSDIRNEERDLATLQQTVLREGLQDIAQSWLTNLTQTPSSSLGVQRGSSGAPMASDMQGSSRPSITSSATVVEIGGGNTSLTHSVGDWGVTDTPERNDTRQIGSEQSSQMVDAIFPAQETATAQSQTYSLTGEFESNVLFGFLLRIVGSTLDTRNIISAGFWAIMTYSRELMI